MKGELQVGHAAPLRLGVPGAQLQLTIPEVRQALRRPEVCDKLQVRGSGPARSSGGSFQA